MTRKPIICITSEHTYSSAAMKYVPMYLLDKGYGEGVALAGGLPMSPLGICLDEVFAEISDALLLTGGSNIHPARYGTPYQNQDLSRHTNIHRDNMEFDLFEAFLAAGKPIFGIGRGLQLINVALGGTLLQEIDVESGVNHGSTAHPITIEDGSFLSDLFGKSMRVNSLHHQAAGTLGKGLKVVATATDGIIEAIQHESLPIFAVQFHPEITYGPTDLYTKLGLTCCKKIFELLVKQSQ